MKILPRSTLLAAAALLALAAALLFNTHSRAAPPAQGVAASDRQTPAPDAAAPVRADADGRDEAADGVAARAPAARDVQARPDATSGADTRTYPTTAGRTKSPPAPAGSRDTTHSDGRDADALAGLDDFPDVGNNHGHPLRC